MLRVKKSIVILSILSMLAACNGQTKKNEVYNKDFNWVISIPDDFERVSPDEWEKMQNKGLTAIENTYDQEVVNQSKTIFVFKSGPLDYLESNYQSFDPAVDGDYNESWKGVNAVLYETFSSQLPGIKIDSATSIEKIDNLEFRSLKMKITYPNNMVMTLRMYSRLFDKKEFTVNIMYVDEDKGKKMLDAWVHSKFSK